MEVSVTRQALKQFLESVLESVTTMKIVKDSMWLHCNCYIYQPDHAYVKITIYIWKWTQFEPLELFVDGFINKNHTKSHKNISKTIISIFYGDIRIGKQKKYFRTYQLWLLIWSSVWTIWICWIYARFLSVARRYTRSYKYVFHRPAIFHLANQFQRI